MPIILPLGGWAAGHINAPLGLLIFTWVRLGRKKGGQAMFTRLRDWHIKKLNYIQEITGLSAYQMLWLAFIEGVLIGLFAGWWLFG